MMGRTHLAIGILAAVAIGPQTIGQIDAQFIGLAALGALLPDLDSPTGLLSKMFPVHLGMIGIGHRGPLHSVWPVALLIYLGMLPLAIGYASHLAADAITLRGIRPLWPLPPTIRGLILTGSLLDHAAMVAAWAGAAYLLIAPVI